jgi:tetratricopeptide (TPR) repeat protein
MKIKTADSKKHEAIRDNYEGVVNRYPYSPGAMMAELRLSSCYKGLKSGDPTRAFFSNLFTSRDMKKFDHKLVDSGDAEAWMDLAESRFFVNNGEYRLALKRADDYRPLLSKHPLGESFRKTFSAAIQGLITSLGAGTDVKAETAHALLAAAAHYGDYMPKPEPIAYMLSIAKARQQEGDLPGIDQELKRIEVRLAEATDSEKDEFRLLKAGHERLIGAKPDTVMAQLGFIRDQGELGAAKYDQLARSAVDKNDFKAALAYDARLLDGGLSTKLSVEQRFNAYLRRLENTARVSSPSETAKLGETVQLKFGTLTQFPEKLLRVRELRAKALYDSKQFKGAIEAINEILTDKPDHTRRTEFEFMRGKAFAGLGRENEALETFKKLAQAASASDVWKKSAQNELDQLQWENNVSNQMKRQDRRSSQ